jgi:hypothetical protein
VDDLIGIILSGLVLAGPLLAVLGLVGLGVLGYLAAGGLGAGIGAAAGLGLGLWLDYSLSRKLRERAIISQAPWWLGYAGVATLLAIVAGIAIWTR